MGLDMYLEGRKYVSENYNHPEKNRMEDGFRIKGVTLELGYWRKHPNLHGFIVQTFADGVDQCQEIPLSKENLAKILQAIKGEELPETKGFFFGASDGTEKDEDTGIFRSALKWLMSDETGYSNSVVYRASW